MSPGLPTKKQQRSKASLAVVICEIRLARQHAGKQNADLPAKAIPAELVRSRSPPSTFFTG